MEALVKGRVQRGEFELFPGPIHAEEISSEAFLFGEWYFDARGPGDRSQFFGSEFDFRTFEEEDRDLFAVLVTVFDFGKGEHALRRDLVLIVFLRFSDEDDVEVVP